MWELGFVFLFFCLTNSACYANQATRLKKLHQNQLRVGMRSQLRMDLVHKRVPAWLVKTGATISKTRQGRSLSSAIRSKGPFNIARNQLESLGIRRDQIKAPVPLVEFMTLFSPLILCSHDSQLLFYFYFFLIIKAKEWSGKKWDDN